MVVIPREVSNATRVKDFILETMIFSTYTLCYFGYLSVSVTGKETDYL